MCFHHCLMCFLYILRTSSNMLYIGGQIVWISESAHTTAAKQPNGSKSIEVPVSCTVNPTLRLAPPRESVKSKLRNGHALKKKHSSQGLRAVAEFESQQFVASA